MYSERSGLWLHLLLSSWICGEVPYLITIVVFFSPFLIALQPHRFSFFSPLIYTRFTVLTIKQNMRFNLEIKSWISRKNKIPVFWKHGRVSSKHEYLLNGCFLYIYLKPISALLVYKMTAFFLLGLVVLHSALSEVALCRLFSAHSSFDMYGFIKNTDILTRLKAWVLEFFFQFVIIRSIFRA